MININKFYALFIKKLSTCLVTFGLFFYYIVFYIIIIDIYFIGPILIVYIIHKLIL